MSQGSVEHTGNPLDVAIDGNGFLAVQTPRGERYTRNGSLQINATGQLVTSEGYPVLGDGGPITLQPNDRAVSISRDGTHQRARRHRDGRFACAASFALVTFANPQRLQKDGSGTFNRDRRRARRNLRRRTASSRARSRNRTCAASSR